MDAGANHIVLYLPRGTRVDMSADLSMTWYVRSEAGRQSQLELGARSGRRGHDGPAAP